MNDRDKRRRSILRKTNHHKSMKDQGRYSLDELHLPTHLPPAPSPCFFYDTGQRPPADENLRRGAESLQRRNDAMTEEHMTKGV
ncbi:hypothetical protein BaRGS_00032200 [Batillaria attramentaria]|uniref:Uncharacterized protein n=1 Tax=Batillaria attramentaria TaxID=370345 RepID=A0ABD0JQ13_9CAEN